jgi:hypothetical protein
MLVRASRQNFCRPACWHRHNQKLTRWQKDCSQCGQHFETVFQDQRFCCLPCYYASRAVSMEQSIAKKKEYARGYKADGRRAATARRYRLKHRDIIRIKRKNRPLTAGQRARKNKTRSAWRRSNREKENTQKRRSYWKNPERARKNRREGAKRRRRENPSLIRARDKTKRLQKRENIRRISAKYTSKNLNKIRQWNNRRYHDLNYQIDTLLRGIAQLCVEHSAMPIGETYDGNP